MWKTAPLSTITLQPFLGSTSLKNEGWYNSKGMVAKAVVALVAKLINLCNFLLARAGRVFPFSNLDTACDHSLMVFSPIVGFFRLTSNLLWGQFFAPKDASASASVIQSPSVTVSPSSGLIDRFFSKFKYQYFPFPFFPPPFPFLPLPPPFFSYFLSFPFFAPLPPPPSLPFPLPLPPPPCFQRQSPV